MGGCVAMYYAADKQKAQRVLTELRTARTGEASATRACLHRIRNEVACETTTDLPRLQAWAALRKLYDAYRAAPERDLKPLWQDAITKIQLWGESLR